ncbi:AAA family ATPase [Limnothrix redekei]|uniref:AAA family ATPase n=1 Tax=Limnothrix redekei LRLZ20PSL1 TaxID=3112953 RepID=A0ABW7CA80_9CYAN
MALKGKNYLPREELKTYVRNYFEKLSQSPLSNLGKIVGNFPKISLKCIAHRTFKAYHVKNLGSLLGLMSIGQSKGRNVSWKKGKELAPDLVESLCSVADESWAAEDSAASLEIIQAKVRVAWEQPGRNQLSWVLRVKGTTLQNLVFLLRSFKNKFCEIDDNILKSDVRNALHCLEKLGILEDKREETNSTTRTGSKTWRFLLRFKTHSYDGVDSVLQELSDRWDQGRAKQSTQSGDLASEDGLVRIDTDSSTKTDLKTSSITSVQSLQRVLSQLPQERLFGIQQFQQKLEAYLTDPEDSWLIDVVGEGGVGKTSLTAKTVRSVVEKADFRDISWVTAKKQYFDLQTQAKVDHEQRSSSSFDDLILDIARDLRIELPKSSEHYFGALCEEIKSRPYLIVIDNLETLEGYKSILSRFRSPLDPQKLIAIEPSKILITSRVKLRSGLIGVRELPMTGIDRSSTIELIRDRGQNIDRIAEADDEDLMPIYDTSRGIPLITHLIVNTIAKYDFPLQEILQQIAGLDDLREFLYEDSVASLSPASLKCLCVIAASENGYAISYDILQGKVELDDAEFKECLAELSQYHLLEKVGSSLHRYPRYKIHSFLHQFMNESYRAQ